MACLLVGCGSLGWWRCYRFQARWGEGTSFSQVTRIKTCMKHTYENGYLGMSSLLLDQPGRVCGFWASLGPWTGGTSPPYGAVRGHSGDKRSVKVADVYGLPVFKCCIHTACIHADMAGAPHYASGPSLTAQGAGAKKRASGHDL